MKKLLTVLLGLLVGVAAIAQTTLSKEERKAAIDHLKATQVELLEAVDGLTQEQLNFKSSNEAWSIAECVEHIAITETNIFGIVEMTLQNEPDPSLRSEVQLSDDQVLGIIESRDQKVKTRPEAEPSEKFGDIAGSLSAFNEKRKSNIKFVKSTDEDLRNRYFDFPFGKVDAYQVVIFMSGHTRRHIKQIEEVKSDTNFPNS